jgi:hypothetical protein
MLLVLYELPESHENEDDHATTIRGAPMGRLRGHDISWWEKKKWTGRAIS